jgi:hypothetical protein
MCPVCLATAVLIAGSATSTGGLTAIAIKRFGVKNAVHNHFTSTPSEQFRRENETVETVPNLVVPNLDQRRDEDVS